MRTEFPYRVPGPDGLPEAFVAVAPPADEFVFVPPQGFTRLRDRLLRSEGVVDPARALGLGGGRLWVLEERQQKVDRREISLAELLEVEIGHVLLHAWVAFTPDGEDPIRIDFNAVALRIFEDLISSILEESCGAGRERDPAEQSGLESLPLKFRNALRGQLLTGEVLEAVTFAPAVWERRMLVLRRRVVAATVLAATDRRLLVIEEGEATGDNTYGSTAYSIPRRRIAGMESTAGGVTVSRRSRKGLRERRIPLSDPDAATAVANVMGDDL